MGEMRRGRSEPGGRSHGRCRGLLWAEPPHNRGLKQGERNEMLLQQVFLERLFMGGAA